VKSSALPRHSSDHEYACSGIPGLDHVLDGGFPRNHLYLIDGEPGTGKTTLAMHFLLEGVKDGERALYVTLSESKEELMGIAQSHKWSLEGVEVFELSDIETDPQVYTIFHPSEIELQNTMDVVFKAIDRLNPQRVVFDSLSEMRLLAREPLRFRRQILEIKRFFSGRDCTVLMLDDKTSPGTDLQLHSLAHGVIVLEHISLDYGEERRRLEVTKLRGHRFRGGFHDFRIRTGGLAVYPRIPTTKVRDQRHEEQLSTGSQALDSLLGGGVERGTSVLVTGAAGTGKSILCTQCAKAALDRGERVQFYLFDERLSTFKTRTKGLGLDLGGFSESKHLRLDQIEPTQLSPSEFASHVMHAVEVDKVNLIIIDSINGYMQSMPEERLLAIQVHELLTYLANHNVTILMTLVQRGIFGNPVDEAAEVSYLADTVILLRYFEFNGVVRQAISVVKKRNSDHEHTIREARIGAGGLIIGEPLVEFQGVLSGIPQYIGTTDALFKKRPTK